MRRAGSAESAIQAVGPFSSLRWRLGLVYALVLAVCLVVILTLVSALVERALIESTAARLQVEAGLIADAAGNAPTTTLPAPEVARILGGQETAVVILDESGTTLAMQANGATADVLGARLARTTYAAAVEQSRIIEAVLPATGDGPRVLVVAAPIRFDAAVASESTPDPGTPTDAPTARPTRPPTPEPTSRAAAPPANPGRGQDLGQGQGRGQGQGAGQGQGKGIGRGSGLGRSGAPGLATAAPGAAGGADQGGGSAGGSGNDPAIAVVRPNAIAQLGVSLAAVDAALTDLRSTLLLVGLVAFAVTLGIALSVTSLGLRPLTRVAAVADQVAAGDLSARAVLPAGADEIGRLGRAFDRMIDRLEAAFGAQRQFAADASHELRSPLTVLGGYVDVLAQEAALGGGSPVGRILASMRREIDRLSRLASDLLLLTQLEAGGGRLVPERVDLGDLVGDLAEAARVMAGDRRVEFERTGATPVMADLDRLTQAMLNLVDNAVRYTPIDGLIRLSSWHDGTISDGGRAHSEQVAGDAPHGWAVAQVWNQGEPIPPDRLGHLFDRFDRGGRGAEPGHHAGLGLAIVKAIVESSGGLVSVASDSTGTRFEVRLPLAL
jgi:two-component system, OmpR family, sensor kinase